MKDGIDKGITFLPREYVLSNPSEAHRLEEISTIVDKQSCSELALSALKSLAEKPHSDPWIAQEARAVADIYTEVRDTFA